MRFSVLAGSMVALLALLTSGCGGAQVDQSGGSKGDGEKVTVNIAINPWVGYEASAAVLAKVLEDEVGAEVEKKDLKEEVAWQGFEKGEVDVIVENWGHPELKKKYIEEKKVAVEAGSTGNKGVIGWYVPGWMTEKYPDITDWKNLNKYAKLFKTSESGDKGQLLFGDPSYVSHEDALIKNLDLNYKVVTGGSEAALIKSAQQAQKQKKPLLFYFWDPHWLFSKIDLERVQLPEYQEGCDADPDKVDCDYPEMDLDKIVSKSFAEKGGDAFAVVKNFNWTNEDQNQVALDIEGGMEPEDAAEKWIEANEDKWRAWLP